MKKVWAALLLGSAALVSAQADELYKYRLTLTDKGLDASTPLPDAPLSERALERRARQGIAIDSTDYPIAEAYLSELREAGYRPVCTSRWLQTVVVATDDSLAASKLEALPFVGKAELVWRNTGVAPAFFVSSDSVDPTKKKATAAEVLAQYYALAVDKLHAEGYRGEGMQIAVIDAGFLNVDKISYLAARLNGTRDFVNPDEDIIFSAHNHGTNTYSVMGYAVTDKFAGTAPKASYWLLRSEDSSTEFAVEEDYWVAAAEYADSLGVDIISSSLGYFEFDDPAMSHTHAQLDGRSTHISRGASAAASKGMLVVVSAGNERANSWQRICVPADSPDVLAVGACTPQLEPASFTGVGSVAAGVVKPDVAAIGQPAYVISPHENIKKEQGTSFACPAIAGAAACLWQALPHLSAREVADLIRANGHQVAAPDSLLGYGVPDFHEAWRTASPVAEVHAEVPSLVCVDSTASRWRVAGIEAMPKGAVLNIYTTDGVRIKRVKVPADGSFSLAGLPHGLYITFFRAQKIHFSQRIYITAP